MSSAVFESVLLMMLVSLTFNANSVNVRHIPKRSAEADLKVDRGVGFEPTLSWFNAKSSTS